MGKKIDPNDIIGNRYGMLTVMRYLGRTNKQHYYECQCDCGNITKVRRTHLFSDTRSCGCQSAFRADWRDIIGKRYDKLVVKQYLGYAYIDGSGRKCSAYLCECDCGNEVMISRHDLISNLRHSCGECFKIVKENDYYRYYCTNGMSWIFDEDCLNLVKSHRWHMTEKNGTPMTHVGETEISFYRMLLNPPDGYDVDHIDGDRSNNRKKNLRIGTKRQNQYNKVISPLNQTGYKGVTFHKQRGKYYSCIRLPEKRLYLGYFDTPEEAARAYDEAARLYFGEFACVNFPRPGEQGCLRDQETQDPAEVA